MQIIIIKYCDSIFVICFTGVYIIRIFRFFTNNMQISNFLNFSFTGLKLFII